MNDAPARILSCGNCDLDHGNLTQMLNANFRTEVERAGTAEEVRSRLGEGEYDLILLNRVFFHDGTEALRLLPELKAHPAAAQTPMIVISNFPEAQEQAQAAGAARGFGKNALHEAGTRELLAEYLPRRETA